MAVDFAVAFAVAAGRNDLVVRPILGVINAVPPDSLDANVLSQLSAPRDRFPDTVSVVADGDERPNIRAKPIDERASAGRHRQLNLAAWLRVACVPKGLEPRFDHGPIVVEPVGQDGVTPNTVVPYRPRFGLIETRDPWARIGGSSGPPISGGSAGARDARRKDRSAGSGKGHGAAGIRPSVCSCRPPLSAKATCVTDTDWRPRAVTIGVMADHTQMDPEASAELHRAVARSVAIHERAQRKIGDPRPGSPAAADAVIPHARWIITSANMAVGVAADHLFAWKLIVDGRQIPVYAPMTLLRTALEGAVLTRWLVDPRPGALERVSRGVAAQLDDYDERRKFETSVKARAKTEGLLEPLPPSAPGKSGADRLAELITARDDAGIPAIKQPGSTDLMMRFGAPDYRDVSSLYRLVSAFAHAKPWALHATSVGPTSPSGTQGIQGGQVTANDDVIIGTTDLVAGIVETAIGDLERYLGIGTSAV